MLTYVQNEKGKQMLLYEGHIFEVNKRTHEGRIIWRCKEYYRKEQALNELQMDQATAGVPTAKPRKKYRDCNERIVLQLPPIMQVLQVLQVLDFHTLIAHNYNF